MALSRILLMAAKVIVTNPKVRQEANKVAQKTFNQAKPYIEKAGEKVKKVAEEAASKSPPDKKFFEFMGRMVSGLKRKPYDKE